MTQALIEEESPKFKKLLRVIVKNQSQLTNSAMSMLQEALRKANNETDLNYILDWMQEPEKWAMPRVSFDTFIDDKYYLGIGDKIYPKVRQICREMLEGGYKEGVEVAGIGAGKSLSAEMMACYAAHYLLCLRNPHDYYNLAKDKSITIINMGISATQASEVVFTGIASFIEGSPFFRERLPRVLAGSIKFEREKIHLMSGNSKSTTPLGHNVFYAILDEAAFYLDNDNRNVAEEIYSSLSRRITSRFGHDGLIVMISSPRYVDDFIMSKLKESREFDPQTGERLRSDIYAVQAPTWKFKDSSKMDLANCFYFNPRTAKILLDTDPFLATAKINRVADQNFMSDEYDVWEIPGEFKADFISNPEKAKRDFGATPSETLQGFFPNPEIVRDNYNTARENPVVAPGKYKFASRPLRTNYYVHVDIGLNKDGQGDHAGFCMGHFGGWLESEAGEYQPQIVIDVMERIGSGGIGEVQIEDIRRRIYDLTSMGYHIKLTTLDGYMCLRRGTKIPIVTFDEFQSKDYTLDMSIKHSVPLLTGKTKKIENIKDGDYVYTILENGDIGFARAKRAICSGKKDIFRIHLDNDKYIDCSGNHPFMLRDGTYKNAELLSVGDSLMPLYRKDGMKDLKGYEMILHPRGKWEYTHRAIARQKKEIERGKIIHHKDFNKKNNSPENLEVMTGSEHATLHGKYAGKYLEKARAALAKNKEAQKRRDNALSETGKRRWREDPEGMKKMLAKANKKRWENPEEKKKLSKLAKERNKTFKPRLGTSTTEKGKKNISNAVKKLWQDTKYKKMMLESRTPFSGETHPGYDKNLTVDILKKYTDKKLYEVCKILNTTQRKISNRINAAGFSSWKDFCSNINHKVTKIEKLKDQKETWDIEVEGTSNFATEAGVFVHNSKDFMQIMKKKGFNCDYLSVDRTIDPYNCMKEAIYEKRLDIPFYEPFEEEVHRLELIKGIKVDHSPTSKKDVCDAVAGVCFNVVSSAATSSIGFATSSQNIHAPQGQMDSLRKRADAELKLKKLQDRVDRRDERYNNRLK